MTEVQRITAAVEAIIGGEREEDERLITRPLTRFITRFRAADPSAVKVCRVSLAGNTLCTCCLRICVVELAVVLRIVLARSV